MKRDLSAQLHSRYNPQSEAARFIDSLNLESGIECFILIEPGLGYMTAPLREKFKDSKIIILHADDSFKSSEVFDDTPILYGTDSKQIQEFLEREVPETEISKIRVIEWRPSINVFGRAYIEIMSNVTQFLKRKDAETRTISAFGKRWVKNFFRNLNLTRQALLYKTLDIPVIITGSSPSLEDAIPIIKSMQDNAFILSASSSFLSLSHNGIAADMIIATDGTSWALEHIYPFFRQKKNTSSLGAIALSMNAALPSRCACVPHLIMNDGSLWQNIILHELGLPSVLIPQRGTVTASALDLAMLLSCENIYLAGMDFSLCGIRSHTRPYAFEHLFFLKENRFNPVYSQLFMRSGLLKQSGTLEVYASWFKTRRDSLPKRIFDLDKTHVNLHRQKKDASSYFKAVSVSNEENADSFCKRGIEVLLAALDNEKYKHEIIKELTPLLFPGEKKDVQPEIKQFIGELN